MALQISLYCLSQLAGTKDAAAAYVLLLSFLTGSHAGQILIAAGHHGGSCHGRSSIMRAGAVGPGAAGAGPVAAQHLRGGPAVQLHQVPLGAAAV